MKRYYIGGTYYMYTHYVKMEMVPADLHSRPHVNFLYHLGLRKIPFYLTVMLLLH